jgi:hypothetical protein
LNYAKNCNGCITEKILNRTSYDRNIPELLPKSSERNEIRTADGHFIVPTDARKEKQILLSVEADALHLSKGLVNAAARNTASTKMEM